MARLKGKIAFITGQEQGSPRRQRSRSRERARRSGSQRSMPELGRAAEQAVREAGGEALFVETDVTQDAAVKRAIDATVARFGG